jgi:sulfide:quinone oxidoreductase
MIWRCSQAHSSATKDSNVSLSIVTPESAPLEEFGPTASASVTRLLGQRGIALYTKSEVATIERRTVQTSGGALIPSAVTVALPVIRARTIDGVPTNASGFVTVDAYCRVSGSLDVFAAGDCTNGPVKQGGLAAQQADTAAAGIAALAGARISPEPFQPELQAVLLTGDAPLHLDQKPGRSPRATSPCIPNPPRRSSRRA